MNVPRKNSNETIELFEHPRRKNVFIVGSYDKRVTLYSQQCRALSLVSALASAGRLSSTKHAAVVGGGVTGLTTAAALLHKNCRVTLFEKEDRLLHLQRNCSTRYIHPHIYDWPVKDPTERAARLPLLSWQADYANRVVEQIETAWNLFVKTREDRIQIITRARYVTLAENSQTISWSSNGNRTGTFDLIFLCAGFGKEPLTSYWENDGLDTPSGSSTKVKWIISGCGDGGLTDLFRLCLVDFHHGKFLQEIVSVVDNGAQQELKEEKFDFQHKRVEPVLNLLKSRLRTDTEVFLNGPEPHPFSGASSILNRFVLSQLNHLSAYQYLSGRLLETTPDPSGKVTIGQRQYDCERLLVRHGPTPALLSHFPEVWSETEGMRTQRSTLPTISDSSRYPSWGPDDFSEASTLPVSPPEQSTSPFVERGAQEATPAAEIEPVQLPSTPNDAISLLKQRFRFRWEPGDKELQNHIAVYWPVRLRPPTPIHATQAYAAALLQRAGAKIYLCIDDFDRKDYTIDSFVRRVKKWFLKVSASADNSSLVIKQFTEVLQGSDSSRDSAWAYIQDWLGTNSDKLDSVLRLVKLWPRTDVPSLEDFLRRKRPKRLLSPPTVWACLAHVASIEPRPLITLGGYDEVTLWEAWGRVSIPGRTQVAGHLYNPSLQTGTETLHMESSDIGWRSLEDIESSISRSVRIPDAKTDSRDLLPYWSWQGCIALPSYLTGIDAPPLPSDLTIEEVKRTFCADLEKWVL